MISIQEQLQRRENESISPPVNRPVFYRLTDQKDEDSLSRLLKEKPSIKVCDTLHSQLKELIKTLYPSRKFTEEEIEQEINDYLNGCPEWAYGVLVYYPWLEKLVHIPDEKEFVELRTNRNLYKITREERDALATKRIGVIGLSVGQSVALTLAMERAFGELRIADFDTLELSNLNRIRTGIYNLGLSKVQMVTREIAEIDPFLNVTAFNEGITEDNIDDFIQSGGALDLLVDECDSLDIKILCRQKARKAHIPVLMDTSDRGMIDIERFDLEPDREILHGLVEESDIIDVKKLQAENRISLSLKIAGGDALSERLKKSIPQIGKTISTWPQLASSVALGGAVTTQMCKSILLKKHHKSGRFYVDVEQIVK